MDNDKNLNLLEQTVSDAKDYCRLQLDKFKLRLLDNLSTFLNSVFSVIIVVLLAGLAIFFLAVAGTLALGALIGYVWAALIIAGVFLIAAVAVYLCRDKLLVDPIVRMLGRLMFEHDKDTDYD